MDLELLTQLGGLGLGTILSVLLLNWKRGDDARHEQQLIDQERRHQDTYRELLTDGNRRFDMMLGAIKSNTDALNGVMGAIDASAIHERTLKRIEDKIDKRNGE